MAALVEPLARIRRHGLQLLLSAVRAGDQRFEYGVEGGHGGLARGVVRGTVCVASSG